LDGGPPTRPVPAATPHQGGTLTSGDPNASRARTPSSTVRRVRRATPKWFRQNALFVAVLGVGVAGRVLVEIAYPYPFVQPDSGRYLESAIGLEPDVKRTSGYPLALRLIPGWRELWPIPIVQHLLGLSIGIVVYAVLVRLRVPRWAAALASAPVLLDPFQVAIEHFILSDSLFLALLVGGLVVISMRRGVSVRRAALAGTLLGCAMLVRSAGALVVVGAAIVLLLGQARWRPALVFVLAVAIPLGAYMLWFHHHHGSFGTNRFPENSLYQRVVKFADCSEAKLLTYERPLCPRVPKEQLKGSYYYAHSKQAPWRTVDIPPGKDRWGVLHAFNRRVIRQQPLRYSRSVVTDALRLFAVRRHSDAYRTGQIDNWQFAREGEYHRMSAIPGMPPRSGLRINEAVASRLGFWSRLYLPGPILAVCLTLGLAAAAGVGRARRSGLRATSALFVVSSVALLITSTTVSAFSWRYQLPQFALLPAVGAIGAVALLRKEPAPDVLTARGTLRRLLSPFGGLRRLSFRRRTAPPPHDGSGPISRRRP
jgi:4-amino-4-deoxy-L-arabinose transferase-like glycosyltransferase